MIKNLEIRRASFFIFISILITSILLIHNDFKIKKENIYIQKLNLQIDKVQKLNSREIIYAKDIIVYSYALNEYEIGDIIEVEGRMEDLLSEKENSYNLFLKSKGYNYKLYAKNMKKIGTNTSFNFIIHIIRQKIIEIIDFLYNDYSGIIRALIVADRQMLSKEELSIFSKSGISHIISISGFHIILISSIFYNILFFLSKKQRYIISAIITFFYVLLIGMPSSAVRAYVFYITYIIAVYTQNRYDIFSIGFLLSSFYMMKNPYILFDYGFCLSFMAVFSIAMFYNIIHKKIKKHLKQDYLESAISLVSVTISAQILTMPYVCYHFEIISIVSILSNIISVPLISFAYPFIILSIVFVKIFFVRDVFVNIVNVIMFLFYKINDFFVSLKYSYIEIVDVSKLLIIMLYILTILIYTIYIKKKIRKNIKI